MRIPRLFKPHLREVPPDPLEEEKEALPYDVPDEERHLQMYMTDEQYLKVLERIRYRIVLGEPFVFDTSDSTGNKYTHCSHGLCSMNPNHWPEVDEYLFPERFVPKPKPEFESGRDLGAPIKYFEKHHVCPYQEKVDPDRGCFWSCRAKRRDTRPTMDEVKARVNELIAEVKARMSQ